MKGFALIPILVVLCSCELVQVVTMFRHGGRYHLNSDYDGNQTLADWGQLTAVGMNQHYSLGGMLRKLYSGFIRPNFNHSEIEAYATNVDRTINSAQSNFFGLFPAQTGQTMPAGLDESLMVPPYRYTDTIKDTFALPNGHQMVPIRINGPIYTCSNLSKEVAKNIEAEHATIDEMNSRYRPFWDRIQSLFQLPYLLEMRNCTHIVDTASVDLFLNRKLPAGFTNDDYENLYHLQSFLGYLSFANNASKAVCASKLNKILSVFDKRISTPNWLLKMTVLSGHDTDLFPMQLLMNLSSSACTEQLYRFNKTNALNCEKGPQFASNIIWELHRNDTDQSNYYVRLRSEGRLMNLCERKSTECNYNEWKARVSAVLIDPKELCPPPA